MTDPTVTIPAAPIPPTPQPRKYFRVPTACVDVDVSLNEFSIDDIKEYLRHVEGSVDSNGFISSDIEYEHPPAGLIADIDRLSLCGLKKEAHELCINWFGKVIGRPI